MYLNGMITFAGDDERTDVAITWGALKALLAQVPDDTLVRVNPITRNLMLSTGQYVDIAEEALSD